MGDTFRSGFRTHRSISMEFTKRDLALLLPETAEAGDAISLRFTHDDTAQSVTQTLRPKIDPSKKISIYRSGQVSEETACRDL